MWFVTCPRTSTHPRLYDWGHGSGLNELPWGIRSLWVRFVFMPVSEAIL